MIVITGADLLVYLGRGDGTLSPPTHITLPALAGLAEVADFNRDGNPDIAVAFASGISVMYGDGKGGFSAPNVVMTVGSTQGIFALGVGDFDADAHADIAVALTNAPCNQGGCASSDVHILYGNGSGSFSDSLVYAGIVGTSHFLPEILTMTVALT